MDLTVVHGNSYNGLDLSKFNAARVLVSLNPQENSTQNLTQFSQSNSLSSSPYSSRLSPAIPDVVTIQPPSLEDESGVLPMSASNALTHSPIVPVPLSGVAVPVSESDQFSPEDSDDVSITYLVSRLDEGVSKPLKLFGQFKTMDNAWNLKFQEILGKNSVYPWLKVMFENYEYLGKAYSFEHQGIMRSIVLFCDYEFTEMKNVQSVEGFSNEKISIGMLGNITYFDGVCTRKIGVKLLV